MLNEVTAKGMREVWLAVPAKFRTCTANQRHAKVEIHQIKLFSVEVRRLFDSGAYSTAAHISKVGKTLRQLNNLLAELMLARERKYAK